ncbi:MAG TPA: SUMF1/EgtB/PvdO family nonheme iron enzyme [Candidatus Hydrogenedentes bacterium]|nr:SUMF1/EgtB/PvdO family nonheme iron enzyme [Candidatus Hydrogenedentota bacterium]
MFSGDNNAIVYYLPDTSWWTNPWGGCPTAIGSFTGPCGGEGEGEGTIEGEGSPVEGIAEGEGIIEEEGMPSEGSPEEGEGMIEGEGSSAEGASEGEGEGTIEGSQEEGEVVVEGEGSPTEGLAEGEGEGAIEGEGVPSEGLPEEGEGLTEGEGSPSEGEGSLQEGEGVAYGAHTADQDGDGKISLSELLRMIQFFNSGGYHCQAGTEDGFAPGPGDYACMPHDSDYNPQDWQIDLSELLRVIQFFNSGGYHCQAGTEDGYAPGPGALCPSPEGEGTAEGTMEGEGEVEVLCIFSLNASQVVPPTTSNATGTAEFSTVAGSNSVLLTIQHNVSQPVSALLYSGGMGTNGTATVNFVSTASPITHVFTPLEYTLLTSQPNYIQISSMAYPNGEIRGQIICGEGEGSLVEGEGLSEGQFEGQEEGSNDGEGVPSEGMPSEGFTEEGSPEEGAVEGEGMIEGEEEGIAEGEMEGIIEGEFEGDEEGEGLLEGEIPVNIDFCARMDDIYTTMQLEIMGPILDLLGDNASIVNMIQCSTADLNGLLVDTDNPPDGNPDMPGPNEMLDGAYELNVIAELVNNPSNYTELPSGIASGQITSGVDPAAVASAYEFNYNALYGPLETLVTILPTLVQNLAQVTLTPEQIEQITSLIPAFSSILAGYATLGDADSISFVLFLTNQLYDIVPTIPITADSFVTLNGILGPDGDADGDGFTNRQEYDFFNGQGSQVYVVAVLNPSINPDNPGEGEIEGEGEGEIIPGEMVSVPAGTFMMGNSGVGDDAPYVSGYGEDPQHQVTLSAYQIGKYEVTNREYCDVLNWALAQGYLYSDAAGTAWPGSGNIYAGGSGTSRYLVVAFASTECNIQYSGGLFSSKTRVGLPGTTDYSMDTHPMVRVSWYGSVAFCNWLSQMQGLTPCYDMATDLWPLTVAPPTSGGYRLPTEAEWERAAAWNGTMHWIYGFTSDTLTGNTRCNYNQNPTYVNPFGLTEMPYTSQVGWFNGINVSPSGSVTTVNSPSPVGCYDMSGNVWEWCQDWYLDTYYTSGGPPWSNPTGPATQTNRVLRGGSWYHAPCSDCRAAYRGPYTPASSDLDLGFRVARTTIQTE